MTEDPWLAWLRFVELARFIGRHFYGFSPEQITMKGEGEKVQFPLPSEQLTDYMSGTTGASPGGEEGPGGRSPPTHSEDYRLVRWGEQRWVLTPTQALVVGALWSAWERGAPDVAQTELLRAAHSDSVRLADVFRRSPSWQSLVISSGAGHYRLCFAVRREGGGVEGEGEGHAESPEAD